MSRLKIITFLIGGCFLLALALWPVGSEGQDAFAAQSFPTRTPTSDAPPATDPPPPTDTPPSGGEPTDPPPATATIGPPPPTVPVVTPTGTQSGDSGFLPTAVACGRIPTLQAKNLINIRSGPGTDYAVAGTLAFGEVRPIIGRAANADWWAIELPADAIGWAADPVVNVSGYTGDVPVLEAPAINGNTPTPGTPWSPTPNAVCPTATPTLPATPSRTPSPAATGTEASTEETATATATVTPAPTDTATLSPAATATLPLVGENPTVPAIDPVEPPPTTPNRNGWVLYAGIGLVVIGGAAYVILSRK